MVQQVIIYIILLLACFYVGYRFYSSIKKKAACDKCGLMQAAKEAGVKKQHS
jgi:hypothetical protein